MLSFLSVFSSVLGIFTSVLAIRNERKKMKIFFGLSIVIFVVLIGTTMHIHSQNQYLRSSQAKFHAFLDQWEDRDVNFLSNGELKGGMVEGMIILESLKDMFPENYERAVELVYEGHDPRRDDTFWEERNKLEDGFEAVRSIIKGLLLVVQ